MTRRLERNPGWVPHTQLKREIDVAFRNWVERRGKASVVTVTKVSSHGCPGLAQGRPKCPTVGAAIAEWVSLGRPKWGFAGICRKHGAHYSTAVARREREKA
jgi:hypothetical protein